MSQYCIYEKIWPGTLYEPSEVWCEVNLNHDCENCPYNYSKEDYEYDQADLEYDEE